MKPRLLSLFLCCLVGVSFAGCAVFPEIESEKPKPFHFRAPLDLRLTSHFIRNTETYPQKEYWWYGGREYSPGILMEHRQLAVIVITCYTNADFEKDKSGTAFAFGPMVEVFHASLREYQDKAQDRIILRKDVKTADGVYCVIGVLDRRAVTEKSYVSDLSALRDSIEGFGLK